MLWFDLVSSGSASYWWRKMGLRYGWTFRITFGNPMIWVEKVKITMKCLQCLQCLRGEKLHTSTSHPMSSCKFSLQCTVDLPCSAVCLSSKVAHFGSSTAHRHEVSVHMRCNRSWVGRCRTLQDAGDWRLLWMFQGLRCLYSFTFLYILLPLSISFLVFSYLYFSLSFFELELRIHTSWWLVVQIALVVDEDAKDNVGHHRRLPGHGSANCHHLVSAFVRPSTTVWTAVRLSCPTTAKN